MLAFASAEAVASGATSASCYDAPEYIFVFAVIVTERELRNIQRQILFAELVIAAHDSAFQQRPEAFDVIRVNIPAHVFMRLVVYVLMRESLREFLIARAFVCGNQIDFIRYGLAHELRQSFSRSIVDNLASDVALAGDRTDDGGFVQWATSALFLAPMAILVLAADVGFVHFDLAHQFGEIVIFHRGANPRAHIPHGFVAGALRENRALNLKCAHALLTVGHQEHHLKPHAQLVVRVLENRSTDNREAIAVALVAGNDLASLRVDRLDSALANPMERPMRDVKDLFVATARATDCAIGPALGRQIGFAAFFGRELSQQFRERHGEIMP